VAASEKAKFEYFSGGETLVQVTAELETRCYCHAKAVETQKDGQPMGGGKRERHLHQKSQSKEWASGNVGLQTEKRSFVFLTTRKKTGEREQQKSEIDECFL